jgi:hypothetical protein
MPDPIKPTRTAQENAHVTCAYCHCEFTAPRSTKKFCHPQHKQMFHKPAKEERRPNASVRRAAIARATGCARPGCDRIDMATVDEYGAEQIYICRVDYDAPLSLDNSEVLCTTHFHSMAQARRSAEAKERSRVKFVELESVKKALAWVPKTWHDLPREVGAKPFVGNKFGQR